MCSCTSLLRAQHKGAYSAVSPSEARDFIRQADTLMGEADQFGVNLDAIRRAIATAPVVAGGDDARATSEDSAKRNTASAAAEQYRQMQLERWQQAEKLYTQAIGPEPDIAE
jgi:hypothetical protein